MLLEHPDLPAFEPQLRRITDTAFTGGLDALTQAGRSLTEIEHDLAAYRRFIRGCHYGFSLAQSHIADAVVDLEDRIRAATATRLKGEARAKQVKLVRTLRNRQLVLRKVLDAVLFQVMWPEHRASRYFATEERLHEIDPLVLKRTAAQAHRMNRDDRMKFHVICDLTLRHSPEVDHFCSRPMTHLQSRI